MTDKSDRALSIENGLAIAEFIQENRGNIQATYGRSSIGEPSTRDRAKAWEVYIDKTIKSDTRPERGNQSTSGKAKGQSDDDIGGSDPDERGQLRRLQEWYNATGQRDYDSGYAGDDPGTADREWNQDTSDLHDDERGPILDPTREKKSEISHEASDQHDASGGQHDSQRNSPINKGIPKDKSVEQEMADVKDKEIPNATLEVMDEVIDETDPIPTRKLQGISNIAKAVSSIPEETLVVKKTTEENTPLSKMRMDLSLKAGAIHNVPQSHQHQENSSVSVENAQINAPSVQMNQIEDLSPISPSTTIQSSSTITIEKKA